MCGWMDECVDGWMDGWIDRWMDGSLQALFFFMLKLSYLWSVRAPPKLTSEHY